MPTSARELAPITRIDWNTGGIPKAGPDPTDRPSWEKLLIKPSKAVVVLSSEEHGEEVAMAINIHQSRETKELDIDIEMLAGARVGQTIRQVKLINPNIDFIASSFFGGELTTAAGVRIRPLAAPLRPSDDAIAACVQVITAGGVVQSTKRYPASELPKQIKAVLVSPASAEHTVTDEDTVDISDMPHVLRAFDALNYNWDGDVELSHSQVTMLLNKVAGVDMDRMPHSFGAKVQLLGAVDKKLGAPQGTAMIASVGQLFQWGAIDEPVNFRAAVDALAPQLTMVADVSASVAEPERNTEKRKAAPPHKSGMRKATLAAKDDLDYGSPDDEEDEEESDEDSELALDQQQRSSKKAKAAFATPDDELTHMPSDLSSAGFGFPRRPAQKPDPKPKPKDQAEVKLVQMLQAITPVHGCPCDTLRTLFQGPLAASLRTTAGIDEACLSTAPASNAEKEALTYYLGTALLSLEEIAGSEYRAEGVSSLGDLTFLGAKLAVALRKPPRPPTLAPPQASNIAALTSLLNSSGKVNKSISPEKRSGAVSAATVRVLREDVTTTVLDSFCDGVAQKQDVRSLLSSLQSAHVAELRRCLVSNGEVDAGGTEGALLAHIPRVIVNAAEHMRGRVASALRTRLADDILGGEQLSLAQAQDLAKAAMQCRFEYDKWEKAALEARGSSLQSGSVAAFEAAWNLLEVGLEVTLGECLGLNEAAAITRLRTRITVSARAVAMPVAERKSYLASVLENFGESMRLFCTGALDKAPSLQDALEEKAQAFQFSSLSAKLTQKRKEDERANDDEANPVRPGKTRRGAKKPKPAAGTVQTPGKPPPAKPPPQQPPTGLDPNRAARGHATKSGWKTRKHVGDAAVFGAIVEDFESRFPDACSWFNLKKCTHTACPKKQNGHCVPNGAQKFSDDHGLEMTW